MNTENNTRIVLASASPRRAELLSQIGIEFEVCPSEAEEITTQSTPELMCQELARIKAMDIGSGIVTYVHNHPKTAVMTDTIVIGADTIVALENGTILGKPHSDDEAKHMLRSISGKTHSVFTGVTLLFISEGGRAGETTFCQETKVMVYDMDEEDIKAYIDTGSPFDKAGGYGIQDSFARHIRCIVGDYYNVMGLPIARIVQELKALGLRV